MTVLGHDAAIAILDRALASGKPSHAWVFSGPPGIGKRTAALAFAAALNCNEGSRRVNSGCECRSCQPTLAGQNADVEVIAPGGICDESEHKDHLGDQSLRICQVRRVGRVLSLGSYVGGRRIAIIDAADTLRDDAANAFLKTLEEPPEGSIIILLAEREERLPETVLSRCQRVAFRPVDRATVEAALRERGAEAALAASIAAAAAGRLGWAVRALEDAALLEERSAMLDNALRLAHAGRAERFAWARGAASEGSPPEKRERFQRELALWQGWWRDVLSSGAGNIEGGLHPDRAADLAKEGKLYPAPVVVAFLRSLALTREYIEANVEPQLALENLMLDLPAAGRSA